MNRIELDALKALEAKATPGEWKAERIDFTDKRNHLGGYDWAVENADSVICNMDCQFDKSTAEYIAAARNALPRLIADLEEARKEIAWIADTAKQSTGRNTDAYMDLIEDRARRYLDGTK